MKFFTNKKADEKYLSFWMFLIWAIIGVSIVLGVLMFYSVQGDVRQIEAQSLVNRLSSCLSFGFNYEEITKSDFNIYLECGLNKYVFDKQNFYYFNINITDGSITSQSEKIISGGNNWKTECDYQLLKKETEKESKFPQCAKKDSIVFDSKTNKKYVISVIAASNQK